MYIPMVDTLFASTDIFDYEESTRELRKKLKERKEEAGLAATKQASTKVTIEIGNLTFQVLAYGKTGHAYILHNDLYEVNLSEFRSKNDDFYPVNIRIKSECLWSYGPERAWENIISWVQNNVGGVKTDKISRIDICVHTDNLELSQSDADTFKGKFHNQKIYLFRRKVTGMDFGFGSSSHLACRIYNKSLEVEQKGNKLWFKDIWSQNRMSDKKVWNVEFQINREFLKEHTIETVRDAFHRLKTMWSFCTENWIVKVNLDHTRVERCTINEVWKELQRAFDDFKHAPLIKRERQLAVDAEALVPGTFGNITTFAARKGITDMNLILAMLKVRGEEYLSHKEMSFTKAVNKKMSLMDM